MKRNLLRVGICALMMIAGSAFARQPGRDTIARNVPVRADAQQSSAAVQPQPPADGENVVITNRSYRQIFEPYLFPHGPVFITSDAVLQAFDVLLAHSLDQFEQSGSASLLQALRLMLQQVSESDQDRAKPQSNQVPGTQTESASGSNPVYAEHLIRRQRARLHARIVVSVALQLIDKSAAEIDPEIAAIIETEVRRVEAAEGTYQPDWLESTEELAGGIDYAGFQPYGIYLRSENLMRYFRAMRWLQSVPFRIDSDEELLSVLLLAKAFASSNPAKGAERREAENYLRCRRELFGRSDDPDVLLAAAILKDRPADLEDVRQRLRSATGAAMEGLEGMPSIPLRQSMYILFPVRLPDEEFFQRRLKNEDFAYSEPSGLEICALLGSGYARRQLGARLPEAYRKSLQAEIDRFGVELAGDSLYSQYLQAMAALLDAPEPDAPAFTAMAAWEAKSCNSVLAGWVQMRKQRSIRQPLPTETIDDSFAEAPTGFVEPDPAFFNRLGEMSERILQLLDRCGALPAPAKRFAAQLREFDRLMAEERFPAGADDVRELSSEEQRIVESALKVLSTLANIRVDSADAARHIEPIRSAATTLADALEQGVYDQDPTFQALVIESGGDLRHSWQQLRGICRRLEVMAHKQLREVTFNDRETYFLTDFGRALAAAMLYSGDSYRRPIDDAPVAFPYFIDPRSKKHLHAAVARPREIIVWYPFGGRYVLCRGAVMPYYQFIAATVFTDQQWRKRLDSDERPSPVRWLDPVMSPGMPEKSWRQIEPPNSNLAPASP